MEREEKLLPCPFCGGEDIRYSDKTATIHYKRKRHVACYCNNCHCYGSRLLVESKTYRGAVDGSKQQAIQAWNKRKNITATVVERGEDD